MTYDLLYLDITKLVIGLGLRLLIRLASISIKHKSTRLSHNPLVQILAIMFTLGAATLLSAKFGMCGWNPALACGYISFAVS